LCIILLVLAGLAPLSARADGGVARIREAQGPFVVTIFTPAEVLAGTPTEVSVMVQQRKTGQVLADADVNLSFAPPVGAAARPGELICAPSSAVLLPVPAISAQPATTLRATHAQAANKLLCGTSVRLRAVGDWQVRALVRHGGQEASITCLLPVRPASSRLARLSPYLALPPLAIALFAINQWLRMRMARQPRVSIRLSEDQFADATVALATGQLKLLPEGVKHATMLSETDT
jgi:hypothetical protein